MGQENCTIANSTVLSHSIIPINIQEYIHLPYKIFYIRIHNGLPTSKCILRMQLILLVYLSP